MAGKNKKKLSVGKIIIFAVEFLIIGALTSVRLNL